MRGTRVLTFAASVAVAVTIGQGTALAGESSVTVANDGPGPAEFDRVYVEKFGPKRADTVLVLMPGTQGGAGDFRLLAREVVKRVEDLQVWAIDRRSQVLEDTAMFERAQAGEVSLQEMFDYYLGWITNGGTPEDHFDFLDASTVPFAKEWGMETALEDARAVVKLASRKGRGVILGGHSLGASLTTAYASWDFNGKPGFEDVEALVLIDGGLLGSFDAFDVAEAQQALAELDSEGPFLDLLGVGIPEAAGLFGEIGAMFAILDPAGSAATLESFPLLPESFKPPVPVTNRGLLGYAFDRDTSPESLGLLHVNSGQLAESGEPRDWVDGGVTPVERLARTFGTEPFNAIEWYFPRRLSIDTNGANELRQNDVARFLGLRLRHSKKIDVPVYAFQTDLTDGRVLRGAKALIKRAKTTRRESLLVDGAPEQSHLDPLTAAPKRNEFLKELVGFLDGLGPR